MPTKERWAKMTAEKKAKELARTKRHQQENPEYWNKLNSKYYYKISEGTTCRRNNLNRTKEEKAQRARDKSNLRCTRAKYRRFDDEFTKLVVQEGHDLRRLRNECTGIEWHVDHIVPLNGKYVSGLHIWSNIQVIPKLINLIKGNTFAVYEERP
jgi:hypothetical protein